MVIIAYDVNTTTPEGEKRLRKVAKICMDYGQRVQNSLFECLLNESQFVLLKNSLLNVIDAKMDSVRFYFLGNNWNRHVEHIGVYIAHNFEDELII